MTSAKPQLQVTSSTSLSPRARKLWGFILVSSSDSTAPQPMTPQGRGCRRFRRTWPPLEELFQA